MKKLLMLSSILLLLVVSCATIYADSAGSGTREKIYHSDSKKVPYETLDLLNQYPENPIITHRDGRYEVLADENYHGLYLEPDDCLWTPEKEVDYAAARVTITAEASSFKGIWIKVNSPTDVSHWGMFGWERINSGMYRNQNGASECLDGSYRVGVQNTRSVSTEVYSLDIAFVN